MTLHQRLLGLPNHLFCEPTGVVSSIKKSQRLALAFFMGKTSCGANNSPCSVTQNSSKHTHYPLPYRVVHRVPGADPVAALHRLLRVMQLGARNTRPGTFEGTVQKRTSHGRNHAFQTRH